VQGMARKPMKLYLVTHEVETLMEGTFINVLGVYSSRKAALNLIKDMHDFKKYEKTSTNVFKYIFDGEMTEYYVIKKVHLDKFIL
jgi:hypothetical protein